MKKQFETYHQLLNKKEKELLLKLDEIYNENGISIFTSFYHF